MHPDRNGLPVLVALPGFEQILDPARIPADRGDLRVERFANGELHMFLTSPASGRTCLLVGSAAPPESNLAELLLAADTLKRNGAAQVHAVLPYLAYARQDRPQAGASLACAWLGRAMAASGIDALLTVDAHSDEALGLLGLRVRDCSPAGLLAAALDGASRDAVVVAPDRGAVARATAFAAALGLSRPIAWLEKSRTARGISHRGLSGEIGRQCIVVDDILDSGATLLSCCSELRSRGAETIDIAVTHALFTGSRWRALLDLARSIHVTDTIPEPRRRAHAPVAVHTVAPLLEAACGATASPTGGFSPAAHAGG